MSLKVISIHIVIYYTHLRLYVYILLQLFNFLLLLSTCYGALTYYIEILEQIGYIVIVDVCVNSPIEVL